MANAKLLSLANSHRREIVQLNNLARRDYQSVSRHLRTVKSDKEWARTLRSTFTEINRQYRAPAATLSASMYDTARDMWIVEYGVKNTKRFVADPSLVMGVSDELLDGRMRETGYHIDKFFKGELTRSQVYKPIEGLLTASVADNSRAEQRMLAQEDPFAKDTKRVVRGTGCEYCQLRGWVEYQDGFFMEEDEEGFHAHCSCVEVTEFEGGDSHALYQPWMDDFDKEFNTAHEQLSQAQEQDTKRDPKHSITRNNLLREIRNLRK